MQEDNASFFYRGVGSYMPTAALFPGYASQPIWSGSGAGFAATAAYGPYQFTGPYTAGGYRPPYMN